MINSKSYIRVAGKGDNNTTHASESPLTLLVVIINYNTAELTLNCITSVLPQLSQGMEVVVVDNDSTIDSKIRLENGLRELDDQRVSLVCSDKNKGFSTGNNSGIKKRVSNYYLLLNSDTIIKENAICQLLSAVRDLQSDIGIFSPRLEFENGAPQISCFNFHSAISEFVDQAQLKIIDTLFSNWNLPKPVSENITFPEWTSFACVLIKQEVLKSVGFLDEKYFLYYEDVDFCYQARLNGWRVANVPTSRVIHLRGGSSNTKTSIANKERLPRYLYQSRSRYFAKNCGGRFGLIVANLAWYFGRLLSFSKIILWKMPKRVSEGQYRDIWINFLNPLD